MAAKRSWVAIASLTLGWVTPKTINTSPISVLGYADPSCTVCRPRSAKTGSRKRKRCSWATRCFPWLEPEGDVLIHAAFIKPEGSPPAVKILHHTAICLARKRIWIQNPYFIPEPEAIDALGRTVARGADVRVMMPSSTAGSDNPMVQHAGHRNFEKLLRCGVRLFDIPIPFCTRR
jgi:phosphatidylserine/phosphatidylglycerophosphate/cardiolipin synthase-like enzyme